MTLSRLKFEISPVVLPQQTEDIGPMLVQRLRRWPNTNPTLDECVFSDNISGSKQTHSVYPAG